MKSWWQVLLCIVVVMSGVTAAKIFRSSPHPVTQSTKSNALAELISKNESFELVQVGDYSISTDDLRWELENHIAPMILLDLSQENPDHDKQYYNPKLSEQVVKLMNSASSPLVQKLFFSLVERKLVYEWIVKHSSGFSHSASERYLGCVERSTTLVKLNPSAYKNSANRARLKSKLCEQDIIQQYVDEVLLPKLAIPESEIKQTYMTKFKNHQKSPKVIFAQILVSDEVTASRLKKTLTKENFGAIAKESSISPEGQSSKGLMGPFSREQLPQLFEVVFEMEPGAISNVIASEYGYHIFHLIHKYPSGIVPFEHARAGIVQEIKRKRVQSELDKLLDLALNVVKVVPNSNL